MPDDPATTDALRDAVRQVRALKARLAAADAPVAVVGLGLVLPDGITDLRSLGEALAAGRPRWSVPPSARREGWNDGLVAGWVANLGEVDLDLLGVPEPAAAVVDPAVRLLLRASRQAWDQAGLDEATRGRTGVFVAAGGGDWSARALHRPSAHPHAALAATPSAASGRVAHALDLHGPSQTVGASCASGLVALDAAVQALRAGRCDAALVGAAHALVAPAVQAHFEALGLVAGPGGARPFDADGEGYVRAEGAVVLVLQRHDDAVAAGRGVHGLVTGTATGAAGRTNGLGAPSRAMHVVPARAAAGGSTVAWVEAHGVGAPLADQMELEGLGDALGPSSSPRPVHSAKAVVGHLEPASGLVGVAAVLGAWATGTMPTGRVPARPIPPIGDAWAVSTAGEVPAGVALVHAYGMTGHVASACLAPPPEGSPAPRTVPWRAGRTVHAWLPVPSGAADAPEDVASGIARAVRDLVGQDVDPDTPLTWQGVDSLSFSALRQRLEDAYDVELDEREVGTGHDVHTLARLVQQARDGRVPDPSTPRWGGLGLSIVLWVGILLAFAGAWWTLG